MPLSKHTYLPPLLKFPSKLKIRHQSISTLSKQYFCLLTIVARDLPHRICYLCHILTDRHTTWHVTDYRFELRVRKTFASLAFVRFFDVSELSVSLWSILARKLVCTDYKLYFFDTIAMKSSELAERRGLTGWTPLLSSSTKFSIQTGSL